MVTKKFILLVSLIFTTVTTFELLVMQGTVLFPLGITSHGAKVYHGGTMIPVNTEDNHLTFSIKAGKNQKVFYILIANAQDFEYAKKQAVEDQSIEQTIQYRSILQGKTYKLYRVRIMPKEVSIEQTLLSLDNSEIIPEYDWYIESLQFMEHDIIPDDTIVVLYNPNYVQGLQSEGTHKLPTIIIKNDIEDIEKLHEYELINLLASLDTDTIHAPTKRKITVSNSCKRIIDYIG